MLQNLKSMLNLILPLFLIGLLWYRNFRKKKSLITPSSIVLSLYFLSIILAFPYIAYYNDVIKFQRFHFDSIFIFCILLLLYLLPFIKFREDLVNEIALPNLKLLHLFSICVCLLSLFSLVYFIPTSFIALTTSDIGNARISMVTNGDILVTKSIYNTIAGTTASFYQLPIYLFFIYQILGIHKILKFLLFLSSFSYIFFVLSFYGRDGIVFWFISFIAILGFFRSFLSNKFIKKIFKRILILLLFAVFGFMVITFSRFKSDPIMSMVSYIGQGIPNFCLSYQANPPIASGSSFPLFRSILGLSDTVDNEMQNYILESKGTYSYVFGTFLKSFMLSLGFCGTIMLGVFCTWLFKITISKSKKISFASFLIYGLYFQIFYQGVFYFRQYNRVGNLVIIAHIVMFVIFNIIIKSNTNSVIIKKGNIPQI